MTTETIKARELQDGDVQVSDAQYQTRVIRNPQVTGADVHFQVDDTPRFLALQVEQDVTIAVREFEWLGDNDDDLMVWIKLQLRARSAKHDVRIELLPDGRVRLLGRGGDPVIAQPGDSIQIVASSPPDDPQFLVLRIRDE